MAIGKARAENYQSKPIRNIRELIELFDRSGELVRVKKSVNKDTELMAILKRAQTELKKPVLFENVKGTDFMFVGNLFGGRDKLARIFGVREEEVVAEWIKLFHAERRKPIRVDSSPCQEVVHQGKINVGEILPIPYQYRGDAVPFINSAIVVAKDPKTKTYNASFNRMQLREGNRLGIQLVINMDLFFSTGSALCSASL